MPSPQPAPKPAQPNASDPSTEWHRPMLRAMADIVMAIAQAAGEQAVRQAQDHPRTEPPAASQPAAGLLVTRLARALRQIVALDQRLATEQRAGIQPSRAEQSRRAAAARRRGQAARADIRRHLHDAVDAQPRPDRESLLADLEDRLANDDIDLLLATDTVQRIVVDLCTEFGIRPDYGKWTDEELASLDRDDPPPPEAAGDGGQPPGRRVGVPDGMG